jgi:hypothetical protein
MSEIFKGLTFAFNKDNKFSIGENQILIQITEHGGKFSQNVDSNTNFLLSSHNNSNFRVTLAKKYNVPLVGYVL